MKNHHEREPPASITLPGTTAEAAKRYCDIAAKELAHITGHSGPPLHLPGTGHCHYHLKDPVLAARLCVHRAHRKHLLPPMAISLCIDGQNGHASIHIAACTVLWQNSLTALDLAQWAAGVITPVLDDRIGILRVIRRVFDSYEGLPVHVASDHLVDASNPEPASTPASEGGALCEAILWTWSGKGDRRVVMPNYDG